MPTLPIPCRYPADTPYFDYSSTLTTRIKEKSFFATPLDFFSADRIKIIFLCIGVADLNCGNNKAL